MSQVMTGRVADAGIRELPITIIEPARGWAPLRLSELWEFRELLYFLTWRDIKVRYKQTALGASWAIIQPLATMAIFTLFFGRLGHIPSDGVPYPVFTLTALVPWTFFNFAVTQASNSLVGSQNLIKKIYFPRLLIPTGTILAGLVDLVIGLGVLAVMLFYYGIVPGTNALLLPFFIVLAVATALGVGLWFSALNVRYRDVKYVVPFLTQFWLFATPIAYPSSLLKAPWRSIYGLNPMAGVVEGFRWALLGTARPPGTMFALSVIAAAAMLISGAFYFRRMERHFADVV
jgi:lipopolysaccharide transport system permease protein